MEWPFDPSIWGVLLTWFAVALNEDVKHGMAIPCSLAGSDLVIWRSALGKVSVWADRCPHRGMRLSQGFVRGETLSCIYHGWQYGSEGGCVSIPAHPNLLPPKSICATTYQCAEANGVIWTTLTKTTKALPLLREKQIPVRTIHVDGAMNIVANHFGSPGETVIKLNSPYTIQIALQPISDTWTALHALTSNLKDRKGVSGWLEMQRADLERSQAC